MKNNACLQIALDASDIGVDMYKGGVYHYIINLLSHLKEIDHVNQYHVFFNYLVARHRAVCQEAMQKLEGENMHVKLSRFPRRLRKRLRIPMNLFIGKVDIFHGPFDNVQPVLGCKKIVTIHDLRYFDFPAGLQDALSELDGYTQYAENYEGWMYWLNQMRARVASAVKAADHVVTVSDFTREALIKHLQAPQENIHVVHNGISPIFNPAGDPGETLRIRNDYGIEGEYFLHVGHLDPLKNILRIIDAYQAVKRNDPGLQYKLLLITPTPKSYWFYKIVMEKIERLALSKDIHFLHHLADEELPYFYRRATALLLPSLYEGFGLPALEAMACGTPVIVSKICSLPEIVGEAAWFVDPYSTSSIAEGMHKVASDEDLQRSLAARGQERSRQFSWEKTARETLEIYNQVGRG